MTASAAATVSGGGLKPTLATPVGLGRRMTAAAIDLTLLIVAWLWVLATGLSIGTDDEVALLLGVWLVVIGPLYFALYHSTGTGATPGQRECGIAVRGAASRDARVGVLRSLGRAYLGLLVVVPLISVIGFRDGATWIDRRTRSRVYPLNTPSETPVVWAPTVEHLIDLFEPSASQAVWRRARRLVALHRRELVRSVLVVYAGLVSLSALLAPLFISDIGLGFEGAFELLFWIVVSLLLFISGIYWKQATISTAVEAIRRGETIGTAEVVGRTARHVNGLSVAQLLLLVLLGLGQVPLLGLAVLYYFPQLYFAIPAITIEERHVHAAFGRSWRLARNRRFSIAWRLWLSSTVTFLIVGFSAGLAVTLAFELVADASPVVLVGAIAIGLAAACVPVSWALALIGAYWALLHHDLRVAEQARS